MKIAQSVKFFPNINEKIRGLAQWNITSSKESKDKKSYEIEYIPDDSKFKLKYNSKNNTDLGLVIFPIFKWMYKIIYMVFFIIPQVHL